MSKHVFEITNFGSFWHCGEYLSETAYFYAYTYGKQTRKRAKLSCVVIETDDPKATQDAYNKAWRDHSDEVEAAETRLRVADERRRLAAKQAAGIQLDAEELAALSKAEGLSAGVEDGR